jgi:hypothetical protein
MNLHDFQKQLCSRYGAAPMYPKETHKVGISDGALAGGLPLNGLRHPPEHGTTGWFIWSGEEFSEDPDFFKPMHLYHLHRQCPAAFPYLALPPGWRFLTTDSYEDVWFDASLLGTSRQGG